GAPQFLLCLIDGRTPSPFPTLRRGEGSHEIGRTTPCKAKCPGSRGSGSDGNGCRRLLDGLLGLCPGSRGSGSDGNGCRRLLDGLLGLINERSHPPDQTRKLMASPNRLSRKASMLERIFISLRRSGRSSAVHSTPAVRHRWRPAQCPFPRARATPRAAVHGQFALHETAPPIS